MKIVYSFNKLGAEARIWQAEIASASDERYTFIPFNHVRYLPTIRYVRAQLLDNLYFEQDPGLIRMYADLEGVVRSQNADALIVDNCFPYHPEFLRTIPVYKVMRTSDGPLTSYDRDFAYLHAYDHVLYHSPGYSRDLDMAEKLRYCGAKRADLWPLCAFDSFCSPEASEEAIFASRRDIDVAFIGAIHPNKMPLIAQVKKAFGSRMKLNGLGGLKKNLYFNVRYGFPGWVSPIPSEAFGSVYRRTKIGINVHNRGKYTTGNYRFFDLPANGAMQISDGDEYLDGFFEPGEEIVGYSDADDLVDKIRYYLAHEEERRRIAENGYRRVMRDHRFKDRMREAGELIRRGMQSAGRGSDE